MKFLLGSDPEAFFVNNNSGNVVSAARFTVGTKHEPEDVDNGFALLNDNILIEGNVPPSKSKSKFINQMTTLWSMMEARAQTRNAHLENHDVMVISDSLMQTAEAKEFGCSSFRDAWNQFIEIETPQLTGNERPAGMHLHLGFDDERESFKMALVRAFDILVTLPAIEISGNNYRTSNLYGLLGACRIKSYGIECRSLGGAWFNPEYFGWIYDNVEKAFNFAVDHEEELNSLDTITTYIGNERIDILRRYKKLLGLTE